MHGTFDVIVFNVVLRLLNALVSKCSKHLAVERKKLKYGICGLPAVHVWGNILGHPVHSVSRNICANLQVLLTAGVRQSAKVLGPLVQTSPEFSSQWSSQKYCFGLLKF